jgi:hypothetical protein
LVAPTNSIVALEFPPKTRKEPRSVLSYAGPLTFPGPVAAR